MKLLALTIGATPASIDLPSQITTLNNSAGAFGVNIFRLAIHLLILAAVFLTLIFIVYGGFKWMISEGDKKKIEDAKSTLVFSVIGLIVVSLAFLVINILGTFFNVPILTLGS